MMEEVGDDTNGESTFEFVSDKIDENGSKDSFQDGKKDTGFPSPSHTAPFYQSTSSQPPASQYSSASYVERPNTEAQLPTIPFYDPSQYLESKNVLMTPLPLQPQPDPVVSSTSTPVQQFSPIQQSAPVPAVTSQVAPPMPPPHQTYMDPNAPHCAVPLPGGFESSNIVQQENKDESGVWGWIKNTQFLNKVAEKAKSSVDTVITTLDPGMKEIINTGGDISIVVTSGNETKISAVREAFQHIFGKAVVEGIAVQASSIAPQPVGFSAGLKAAEERISNLRQQGYLQDHQVILAIENFITELTPENWFDIGCLLLQDFSSGITLQVYTEAIPISSHFVSQAKDQTPADYPLGWSGHAVTIGQIIGSALGVPHSEWHQALTGVPRREILFLAAKTIAGLYKANLRR